MILAGFPLTFTYKIRCFKYYAFIIVIFWDLVVGPLSSRVKELSRFLVLESERAIYIYSWFRIPRYYIFLLDSWVW
jgi:hypothetical protein